MQKERSGENRGEGVADDELDHREGLQEDLIGRIQKRTREGKDHVNDGLK